LNAILKNVNDHNQELLKQEEEAAHAKKREQEERSREDMRRRRRDEKQSEKEGRSKEDRGYVRNRSRDRGRERSRSNDRDRNRDRKSRKDKGRERSRERSTSRERSGERSRRKLRDTENVNEYCADTQDQSLGNQSSSRARSPYRDDSPTLDVRKSQLSTKDKSTRKRSRSSSPLDSDPESTSRRKKKSSKAKSKSEIVSSEDFDTNPSSVSNSSKMDKYFSATYDPRLDVSLDDLTDKKTGFIAEGAYDEWDRMLTLLKERKLEREERKWEERMEKEKVKVKSGKDDSSGWGKKGSVREWDVGKVDPF
jgi:hypothetical protein